MQAVVMFEGNNFILQKTTNRTIMVQVERNSQLDVPMPNTWISTSGYKSRQVRIFKGIQVLNHLNSRSLVIKAKGFKNLGRKF